MTPTRTRRELRELAILIGARGDLGAWLAEDPDRRGRILDMHCELFLIERGILARRAGSVLPRRRAGGGASIT